LKVGGPAQGDGTGLALCWYPVVQDQSG